MEPKYNRKPQPQDDLSPRLDMSSLVDVSFLLLIYFLVTSTLDPKETDIGMTMPATRSTEAIPVKIDHMQIEVGSNGQIIANQETLDSDATSRELPLLKDRLITYVQSAQVMEETPLVSIAADDATTGQRFIDVLNALAAKDIEIKNVTISGFSE